MEFIKKHGIAIIFIVILLLLAGLVVYIVLPTNGNSYGNRLNNLSKYELTDETVTSITEAIKAADDVNTVTYRRQGRILEFVIDVKDGTTLDISESHAIKILEFISDESLSYFDIQVYLTCSENQTNTTYPMIGYKHKTAASFSWNTKNEITESTEATE